MPNQDFSSSGVHLPKYMTPNKKQRHRKQLYPLGVPDNKNDLLVQKSFLCKVTTSDSNKVFFKIRIAALEAGNFVVKPGIPILPNHCRDIGRFFPAIYCPVCKLQICTCTQ